eukprot:Sdes_comp18028_c0_seq1m7343
MIVKMLEDEINDVTAEVDLNSNGQGHFPSRDEAELDFIDSTQMKPLEITVTDPEKHGEGLNAYVSYKINVKTSMVDFEKSEFSVRRRYQDFDCLHDRLQKDFEHCIVPPLPGKQVKQRLNRFSDEFTEKRRYNLDRFLNRIAKHDTLRQSKFFIAFLQSDVWEQEKGKLDSGMLNLLNTSLSTVVSSKPKNPDDRFHGKKMLLKRFQDCLNQLEATNRKLKSKREELTQTLAEFNPICSLVCKMEDGLSEPFSLFGQHIVEVVDCLKQANEKEDALFFEPVKEYINYCEEARGLLVKREGVEYSFEAAQENLNKKEQERDSIENRETVKTFSTIFGKKTGQMAKEEKLEKLAFQIQKAESDLAEKKSVLNDVNVLVMEEFNSWEKNRISDFQYILSDYAAAQKTYHETNSKLWADILNQFNKSLC